MMDHSKIPLNEQEETILFLMKRILHLEAENEKLKEDLKLLRWQMQEHD